MRKTLFVFMVLPLLALPARAWNSLGHQTVAKLAWQQMSQRERREISDLLKQHPHYQLMLTADVPAGVDTNEWAFLMASVWPDRVRPAKPGQPPKPSSVTRYNVHPHGIELPFLMAGDTDHTILKEFKVPAPNAQTVLSDALATLRNRKASAHDRAVSLCWVLHLSGDLHQPLHAATLVTRKKPRGHGGGGSLMVINGAGKPVSLHAFWDQLPGSDLSYRGVTALAGLLSSSPELKRSKMAEYKQNRTVASWAQESYRCAVDFAYAPDRVQFVNATAIESKKTPASAIPVLKPDYVAGGQEMARRRLALAAHRLTNELKRTW